MSKNNRKSQGKKYKIIAVSATVIGLVLLSASIYLYMNNLRIKTQADIKSGRFFYEMLEKNKEVKKYKIKGSYVSYNADDNGNQPYETKAAYTADVDISELNNIKVNANYSINDTSLNYSTVWIGSDVYKKINEQAEYNKCKNLFYKAKVGDLPNCTHYTYSDINNGLLMITNPPYTDFPHFSTDGIPAEILRNFEKTQKNQYQIYDGAQVNLDGKETYRYNVITQNFKILDLNKTLLPLTGQEDKAYFLASIFGLTRPGRYLTVWIDKDTHHLLKVESKVGQDVLTIEYSDINNSDIVINQP